MACGRCWDMRCRRVSVPGTGHNIAIIIPVGRALRPRGAPRLRSWLLNGGELRDPADGLNKTGRRPSAVPSRTPHVKGLCHALRVLRVLRPPWLSAGAPNLDPQRAAEGPGGIVRLRAVVIDENSIV